MLRKTARECSTGPCTDLAAALTYYGVLALVPAAIALLSLVGLAGQSQQTVDALLQILADLGADSAAETLEPTLIELSQAQTAGFAFVLGLGAALWSASGYVGAFGRGMNRVYETEEGRPVWKLRPTMLLLTLVLVGLSALVALGLVLTGPAAQAVGDAAGIGSTAVTVWGIATGPLLQAAGVLVVALLYYVTPSVKRPRFCWISIGAVVAIVVWVLASATFGLYVSGFASYDRVYGSLAIVVFLLWLWITNPALLFGAELDAELERDDSCGQEAKRAGLRAQLERGGLCWDGRDIVESAREDGAMAISSHRTPQHVAVLGAGMVGLSTAWFLQERGISVTVYDREDVAAGSSWGNAGWLTPSMAVPLPEPSVLKYGLRAVLSPSSPVYIPPTADPRLLTWLMRFARNCTPRRWQRAMQALIPLNNGALAAFDEMSQGGVAEPTRTAEPFTAAFRTRADSTGLLDEFEQILAAGQKVRFEVIDGGQARAEEPLLSAEIGTAIRIRDERFLNPSAYVHAVADSVRSRDGRIRSGAEVSELRTDRAGVTIDGERYDAVVIATGARLGALARRFGVRRVVQAGRGYSFTVGVDQQPQGPIYFPKQRVACTPVGDRLRIAGMMEFRNVAAPLDPRRIQALVDEAGRLLTGIHLDERADEWVGARPCTTDGLPLVGMSRDPHVYIAGGHGMWGITLGPVTGRLLAEQIATGSTPAPLHAVDPLR